MSAAVRQAMSVLGSEYGNAFELTTERVATWIGVLGHLGGDAVKRAAYQWLATEHRVPHVSDIRRLALRLSLALPSAEEAWAIARACSEGRQGAGRMEYPKADNPCVEAAIQAIGRRLIEENNNPEATRAHFLRVYDGYAKRCEEHGSFECLPDPREPTGKRLGQAVPVGALLGGVLHKAPASFPPLPDQTGSDSPAKVG